MKRNKYEILDTPERLISFSTYYMNEIKKSNTTLISIDTETNGLDFWKNVVVGVSISLDEDSGVYVPFLNWEPDTTSLKTSKAGDTFENGQFKCVWSGKTYSETVTNKEYKPPAFIPKLFELWFVKNPIRIVMHNAPFDVLMIKRALGVDVSNNVYCDTVLLTHAIDEKYPKALKVLAKIFQNELGISADSLANQEQVELRASVEKNGGKITKTNYKIWRADPGFMAKYAIADTFLTLKLFNFLSKKFEKEYSEKHLKWFYEDEVMPLCKEVVIPMKEEGVNINVKHFEKLKQETEEKLKKLETSILENLTALGYLEGFESSKSKSVVVTKKKFIKKILEIEGLNPPTLIKAGEIKESFAKGAIKKSFEENPHWVWEYLLGETEIKYSDEKVKQLEDQIYLEETGSFTEFNVRSSKHLTWLFCDKLGFDKAALPQTASGTKSNPIPSMKAEVIEQYFSEVGSFVKDLLLFKKLEKLNNTYIQPAVELNQDGKLYMEMRQDGTSSGRFSCSGGLNLQTLPRLEDLSFCPACKSSNVKYEKEIDILADLTCMDCLVVTKDIICSSAIKEGFIPPKDFKIVNADYSSLEPRCFAFQSGDDKIKQVYLEGLDFYSKIFCDMTGIPYEDLKKSGKNKERNMIKPVALGIPYGARAPQTARLMGLTLTKRYFNADTGKEDTKEVIDVQKGKEMRDSYLRTYKNLHNYMIKQEMLAMGCGFVETIVGRRRHFTIAPPLRKLLDQAGIDYEDFLDMPKKDLKKLHFNRVMNNSALQELLSSTGIAIYDAKSNAPRDWAFVRTLFQLELNGAKNFPIQGLGAHITNKAMLDATRLFKKHGLNARVFLQVHDEISCYASEKDAEKAVELLKIAMEANDFTKKVDIPMIADPIIADTLKEAK